MNNYEFALKPENIVESIKTNVLKRNQKLNILMQLLNTLKKNSIISIDGMWGCGKTVFIKQLEILNRNDVIDDSDQYQLSSSVVKTFKTNYLIYYYNAWENDSHENPVLSLIYNIINDFPKEKKQMPKDTAEKAINIPELLKTLTGNAIDLDKIKSYEDIANEIFTIEEKRNALDKLLNDIIPKEKRLVIIIDELDRCNPNYAVKILESIKHFYSNDKLVFLVASNNSQLSHTISKFYGIGFDGYGYLNKLYDLVITLDEVDTNNYLKLVLKTYEEGWRNKIAYDICKYLKFTMRDANRYVSMLNFLDDYFEYNVPGEDCLMKYLYIPYFFALKIKNPQFINDFISGKGINELTSFIDSCPRSKGIVEDIIQHDIKSKNQRLNDEVNFSDFLTEHYMSFFGIVSDDSKTAMRRKFHDITSLLSSHTNI